MDGSPANSTDRPAAFQNVGLRTEAEKRERRKMRNKKLKPPQRVKAAGSEVKQLRLSVNWWKLNNNVGIETRHKRTR